MPKSSPDRLKSLRARVSKAPEEAGIYRWLNEKGEVLYVGKAKNLRARLKSYVQARPDKGLGPWKLSLIEQIADLDVTVVNSELEALVLETNLIKKMKPKYNVLMKDDKNYVYVRVTMQDAYPRIDIVRKMENDGAKYFGPKTSAEQVRLALSTLRKVYPFRTCKMHIEVAKGEGRIANVLVEESTRNSQLATRNFDGTSMPSIEVPSSVRVPLQVICTHKDRPTPCLDHHIGQCSAPCAGLRTPEEYYKESIEGVIRFLKGDHGAVIELLQEKMKQAAINKKFELAAELRDQLKQMEELQEKQLVSDTSGEDADFIGVALLSNRAQVVLLQERGGKIIGENSFALAGQAESVAEVLEQFLPQYYADSADLPDAIFIGEDSEDRATLEQWLSERKEKKVIIHVPERGKKSRLLELAEKNAQNKAKQLEAKWEADARNTEQALSRLAEALHLPGPPQRIEGYDISHLGGTETVGSMVVMKGGKPANPEYRSFTIHTMKSGMIDDYRALKEVLTRRLRHLDREKEVRAWEKQGVTIGKARKADLPDILELIQENQENLSADGLHDGSPGINSGATIERDATDGFMVARRGEELVAIARIFEHPTGLRELRSVCVRERERGVKLGQFLVRQLLRKETKKVYIVIDPRLEQYYGELGFRYVVKPPPILQEKIEASKEEHPDEPGIAMLYEPLQHKPDSSLSARPNLLVIDGGKGQLSTVVEVLKMLELEIPIIGLAKREEEVFLPGESAPIFLKKDDPALFLLMRLRDEAHRFANRHRERRGARAMKGSILDTVAGIGPETKKILLREFGSVDQVFLASDDALGRWLTSEQVKALRAVREG